MKNRHTEDVIVGAVTGTLHRPDALIIGRYTPDGQLHIAGRTTALTDIQALQLGLNLTPAGPGHPWPAQISSGVFGTRDTIAIVRTEPLVVVEVAADAARTAAGGWRHALHYVRIRADLVPSDIEQLPDRNA